MSIPRGAARAVSFDYGHVLGGLDLVEVARRFVEVGGTSPNVESMRAALPRAYRAHDDAIAHGESHARAWHALMRVVVQDAAVLDARDVDSFVERLWNDQPTRNLWRDVTPEAHALLAALEEARVPMVVTSNSEGRAKELLTELGIATRVSDVLDSGVLGFAKPDRRMFERAAQVVGVPLSALVHVGDSESADVVGAKEAGAWAIRFDAFVPGAADVPTVAHARASTFTELRALLEKALDRTI